MGNKGEMGKGVRLVKADITMLDKISLKNIFKLYKAWRNIKNEPIAIILYKYTANNKK